MDIPETITIYRNKLPKGLSHPIQTSDLMAILDQKIQDARVGIHYTDSQYGMRDSCSRWLFSVNYRGDHNKYLQREDHWDRVVITIHPVLGQYRRDLRELFQRELLPFVQQWIHQQIDAGVQNDSLLRIDYNYWYDLPDYSEKKGLVFAEENKKTKLKTWEHLMETDDKED